MKTLKRVKIKFFLPILFICLWSLTSNSQTVRGKVIDGISKEPLIGATVMIKGTKYNTYVALDGTYKFNKIKAGNYEVIVYYTGYKKRDNIKSINIAVNETKNVDFALEPETVELESVKITSDKDGEKGSRHLEKNANQLVNVLSAKAIQLLPDITVANVLQRISGVTIEKNASGQARYPIIRGMDKRYINTLINGIKIPSPDNKGRFIPLDIFPSELLERLEVSKTLIPSMEGDAIGGTVNLVMKDAPEKELFTVNASAGYNNIFQSQDYLKFSKNSSNSQSPAEINGPTYEANTNEFSKDNLKYSTVKTPVNSTFGLTYGNRFGKLKKLGAIVSGSYQNQYSGTNSFLFIPNASPGINNIPQFETLTKREYSTQSQRLGLSSKIDYKLNSKNEISLFATYVKLNDYEVRVSNDTTAAVNQLYSYNTRATYQTQSIINTTLHGMHKNNKGLVFDWTAVYSKANNAIPDQTTFSHGGLSVSKDPVTGQPKLLGDDILSTMTRNWTTNADRDLALYFNLTQQTKLFNRNLELKAGGIVRDKLRDNFYNVYTLNPLLPSTGGNQLFTSIDDTQYTFKGTAGTPDPSGNNYTFSENINDFFLQGKWQLTDKLEALGGLRVESTLQKYDTQLPATFAAKYGTIKYVDFLPSGQLKYQMNSIQALRLSYYKAIARPQFSELIPDGPANFDLFKQVGNPNLKHAIATNFDLRYELFPGKSNQILVGVFYKNIQNPIELSAVQTGPTAQVLQPINIGTATNYGLEAVYVKYIGAFGVSANYTYTKSEVTNDQLIYKYNDPILRITTKFVSETRPLQGQANHIGNLSFLFKNPKMGLDAQIAYVYTGKRLSILSPYAGLHYYTQPTQNLDFSFQKSFAKNFSLYGKINNITNTPTVLSIHQSYNDYLALGSRPVANQSDPANRIIVQKDYYQTTFSLGLRYKY